MKQKCFISYSHKDCNFANLLHSWLEFYPDQIEVWRDTKLHGGNEWREVINYHIDNSDVFIAIATCSFFYESRFCKDELARFRKRMPIQSNLRIIPVKLDTLDLKENESDELPVSKYQWIDFSQWLREGDKIFLTSLLPIITQKLSKRYNKYEDSYLMHSIIETNALKEIVTDYCSKFPNDIKVQYLFTLVISYLQNPNVISISKAKLATELASLHTQRGEWSQAVKYNTTALDLLKEQGIFNNNVSTLEDELKILIGLNIRQLGLLSRKLKTGKCEQYLKESLSILETISDPILHSDNCAEVYRELCTFYMSNAKLEEAKICANKSFDFLRYIPSQYYHSLQAKNKEAQICILNKEFSKATQIIEDIWPNFKEEDFTKQNSLIVFCQILNTKILLSIMRKEPFSVINELLAKHRDIANKFGLANEKRKNFFLKCLVPFRLIFPFWLLRKGILFYFKA
ncbi:MAG: toll/interleukin-1 receptor domain-containing protein [Blastocatellia bacterium]